MAYILYSDGSITKKIPFGGVGNIEGKDLKKDWDGVYILGDKQKKTIKTRLSSWFYNQKFSGKTTLKFITLTIPREFKSVWNLSDDKKTNKALSKFLENLRKNYGVKNYLWVMERHSDGTPHYHVIADNLDNVDYEKLSLYWNLLIWQETGISAFSSVYAFNRLKSLFNPDSKNYKNSKNKQLRDDFFKIVKSNWFDDIPIDKTISDVHFYAYTKCYDDVFFDYSIVRQITVAGIDSVSSIDARCTFGSVNVKDITEFSVLSSYVTKYISKSNTSSVARVWGSTQALSRLTTKIEISIDDYEFLKSTVKIFKHTFFKTSIELGYNQTYEFDNESLIFDSADFEKKAVDFTRFFAFSTLDGEFVDIYSKRKRILKPSYDFSYIKIKRKTLREQVEACIERYMYFKFKKD